MKAESDEPPTTIIGMLVEEMKIGIQLKASLTFSQDTEYIPVRFQSISIVGSYGDCVNVPLWVIGYYFEELADENDDPAGKIISRFHPMLVVVTVTCTFAYTGDIFKPHVNHVLFKDIQTIEPNLKQRLGSVFGNGPIIEEEDHKVLQ